MRGREREGGRGREREREREGGRGREGEGGREGGEREGGKEGEGREGGGGRERGREREGEGERETERGIYKINSYFLWVCTFSDSVLWHLWTSYQGIRSYCSLTSAVYKLFGSLTLNIIPRRGKHIQCTHTDIK